MIYIYINIIRPPRLVGNYKKGMQKAFPERSRLPGTPLAWWPGGLVAWWPGGLVRWPGGLVAWPSQAPQRASHAPRGPRGPTEINSRGQGALSRPQRRPPQAPRRSTARAKEISSRGNLREPSQAPRSPLQTLEVVPPPHVLSHPVVCVWVSLSLSLSKKPGKAPRSPERPPRSPERPPRP